MARNHLTLCKWHGKCPVFIQNICLKKQFKFIFGEKNKEQVILMLFNSTLVMCYAWYQGTIFIDSVDST